MEWIEQALSEIPGQRRDVLPTPVHELAPLSKISDCRVFCKRDDLTGFGDRRFEAGSSVLFLHIGGNLELFE
jgi:1-aminocyclopropane-1-carboxylate deaminase/D-cysteine desulfhydrase-like pyridoxal-dependent ACC family enzyme